MKTRTRKQEKGSRIMKYEKYELNQMKQYQNDKLIDRRAIEMYPSRWSKGPPSNISRYLIISFVS